MGEGGGLSDVCGALQTYVELSRAGDFLEGEGGREGGREEGREREERERGREGRKGWREGERKGEREGGRKGWRGEGEKEEVSSRREG